MMANDNKDKQFEKLSLWQLLAKTSVEIPIIQRDYAQGRENQRKVRDKFLKTLYEALTEDPVELDFVYGSEENNILQPLDGQQRLTTLFLLHWYIATKENKLDDLHKQIEIRDEKNEVTRRKFSYETRTSSREFCNELTANNIDFNKLLPADTDKKGQSKNNELSKTIKNSAWFVASWEKDPTISAMLIMLDAIHVKFKEAHDLWKYLIDEQKPKISFLYVKLENFGLSDDLYIKMNARGKQLTPFENFKSQFEKYIEDKKFEKDITNPEEKFAHRIDTVWTDLFWQYRGNDGLIDSELINFIAGVAINYFVEKYDSSQKEEVKRLQSLANPPKDETILPDVTPEDFPTKEAFQYLVNCLNVYVNKNSTKTRTTPLWDYCDKTLFEDLINVSDTTQQRRVLFYAQTEYLLKNETFDQNYFDDWMRVIRNLVENAYSGNWNIDNMINLIKLVHSWSENSNGIYTFLSKLDISTISIAKEQVKEEIEKAKLIVANAENKQVIHKTEDTNFCKGEIDFALYCIDYEIDKTPVVETFDAKKLHSICEVIKKYLEEEDVSNEFRRAFFTIQNNDFYEYWSSGMWYGEFDRYCLLENTNDFKNYYALRGNKNQNIINNWSYSKELLNNLVNKSIDDIIKDFQKSDKFSEIDKWKQQLIKDKEFLDKSNRHYVVYHKKKDKWFLVIWNTAVKYGNWDGLIEIKK